MNRSTGCNKDLDPISSSADRHSSNCCNTLEPHCGCEAELETIKSRPFLLMAASSLGCRCFDPVAVTLTGSQDHFRQQSSRQRGDRRQRFRKSPTPVHTSQYAGLTPIVSCSAAPMAAPQQATVAGRSTAARRLLDQAVSSELSWLSQQRPFQSISSAALTTIVRRKAVDVLNASDSLVVDDELVIVRTGSAAPESTTGTQRYKDATAVGNVRLHHYSPTSRKGCIRQIIHAIDQLHQAGRSIHWTAQLSGWLASYHKQAVT